MLVGNGYLGSLRYMFWTKIRYELIQSTEEDDVSYALYKSNPYRLKAFLCIFLLCFIPTSWIVMRSSIDTVGNIFLAFIASTVIVLSCTIFLGSLLYLGMAAEERGGIKEMFRRQDKVYIYKSLEEAIKYIEDQKEAPIKIVIKYK
jgi:hypothetical protein